MFVALFFLAPDQNARSHFCQFNLVFENKRKISRAMLPEILGPCEFASSISASLVTENLMSVPGVALGLAWTPFGGELLSIETAQMPGSGRIILTGRLGETMRESAQIALGWIRSHAHLLGLEIPSQKTIAATQTHSSSPTESSSTTPPSIDSNSTHYNILADIDVHIHFPAGAIPKDGPSAGVAMTTALVSLFIGRPLPANVAMTGEISLSGSVLPVGGIKEKVIAAHAAGCKVRILFIVVTC